VADKLGVGVIGVGFGEKIHIPGFQEHPQTRVVAVAARRAVRAAEVATVFEIPFATDDYRELVTHPSVDLVSIATPPHLHAPIALAAIAAGKPFLIEKPLAHTLEAATEIVDRATAARIPAVIDFEFRFVPAWMLMQRLLQTDLIGRPRFVSVSWLVDILADPEGRRFGWASEKDTGGGILGALGSHVFDYLQWFCGDIREAQGFLLTAVGERALPDSRHRAAVTADDTFGAHLRFASGLVAAVEVCAVGWHRRGHRITAYGNEGTLELRQESPADYIHGAALFGGRAGDPVLEEMPVPEELTLPREFPDGRLAPFVQVVDALVRAMDGQARSGDPDLAAGYRAQMAMEAVARSQARGGWVATGAPGKSGPGGRRR
jgi:predicted dehydrogenase